MIDTCSPINYQLVTIAERERGDGDRKEQRDKSSYEQTDWWTKKKVAATSIFEEAIKKKVKNSISRADSLLCKRTEVRTQIM